MNHQQRVDIYKQYMADAGADLKVAIPSLWEFAWSHGWEVRPPPFMNGLGLAILGALAYPALVLLLWLLLTVLRPMHGIPFAFTAWLAVLACLFGAIVTPVSCRRMARKYGLVNWSTFTGARQRA
ncbi:MAG TPA: DUF6404 family protein [Telluria sp.]|jgi:hypothetical protein